LCKKIWKILGRECYNCVFIVGYSSDYVRRFGSKKRISNSSLLMCCSKKATSTNEKCKLPIQQNKGRCHVFGHFRIMIAFLDSEKERHFVNVLLRCSNVDKCECTLSMKQNKRQINGLQCTATYRLYLSSAQSLNNILTYLILSSNLQYLPDPE
jgi:hypothetical protein